MVSSDLHSLTFVFFYSEQKSSLPGSENTMAGVKSGRRRWGQTTSKPSDSWDDSDRSDSAVSSSKKPSIGPEEEKINKDSNAQ